MIMHAPVAAGTLALAATATTAGAPLLGLDATNATNVSTLFNGIAVPGAPFSSLFLSFLVYGFAGWLWESTICSYANERRFSNSGFLLGPCCPIYGAGALLCWLLLARIQNPFVLFVAAMAVCTALEYAVGWGLERLTGARFWNYDDMPFNIHGRVYLYGALLFGAASVFVCRVSEPALLWAMSLVPTVALIVAALCGLSLLIADAVFAIVSWRKLSARLALLRKDIATRINDGLENVSDMVEEGIPPEILQAGTTMQERTHSFNSWLVNAPETALNALRSRLCLPSFVQDKRKGLTMSTEAARLLKVSLKRRELRFFNAFPKLTIPRYEGVLRLTELKERARSLFRR